MESIFVMYLNLFHSLSPSVPCLSIFLVLIFLLERQKYNWHKEILRAVVEGLENMEEIEDFSEFKYKENLHVQVST